MKHKEWNAVMADEINALLHNQTWTLVSRPPDKNVVVNKGSIALNDCRLVILRGIKQDWL